jgi:putative membrane protein
MRGGKGRTKRGEGDVLKGLAAGLAGGLIASWTMNRFQDVWNEFARSPSSPDESQPVAEGQESGRSPQQTQKKSDEEQDDATVKTASAISESLFDHKLTKSEKKVAGPAVHYAFGTVVGGLYGAATEVAPEIANGAGLPFGAAFWLVADETALPLLGLSKGPTAYPVSTHVYALASHFVYGLTAEVVRRTVRDALSGDQS